MVANTSFPATLKWMAKRRTISLARTAGLVLVAAAWAIFLLATGSPEVVLFTVPVFLLAAPLAFGRYLGEEMVARLRRGHRPARAARPELRLADTSSALSGIFDGRPPLGRAPPLTGF